MSEARTEKSDPEALKSAKVRKKDKTKKIRRRRRSSKTPRFERIHGVAKIILSPDIQKLLGCVVGEDVTMENPWKLVSKEIIDDDLEMREEDSEFISIKKEMAELQNYKYILIGYIPNEDSEFDEFYICTTEFAEETVQEIINKDREEHEEKLKRAVEITARPWTTLGSDAEISGQKITCHRPLYEVEIETSYPIIATKSKFRSRLAADVRDGYAELIQKRQSIDIIFKKRLDANIQAAPIWTDMGMQTKHPYPKNAWTQYEYDYYEDEDLSIITKAEIKHFIENRMEAIYDTLNVTGHINLYENDYSFLVKNQNFTKPYKALEVREFISFTEIKLCKDKMVSAVSWHPFLSGIVACAYTNTSLNTNVVKTIAGNESMTAIYNTNPVLIWSFDDALKPKLILEAHREVNSLAFCPYDDGLVVGGCRNGQIIIWDIKDKLAKVEAEEVLSPQHQTYRIIMFSMMTWMKNIKNLAFVPTTAISDLQYSHLSTVTHIEWLPPFQDITKTGQLQSIDKAKKQCSYQFVSASLDGTVLFWDLTQKYVAQAGEYRAQRRIRRLKRRPSALLTEFSPYRVLHRILKPRYKLVLAHESTKTMPISCLEMPYVPLTYEEVSPDSERKTTVLTRIGYKPVLKDNVSQQDQSFAFGNSEGEFVTTTWDGYEYSSGEVVVEEIAKITNIAKYHDGPVVSISRWPLQQNVILTVGGKIFCIWLQEFKGRPILWRRSRTKYTHGVWNQHDRSTFKLMRADGIYEEWSLHLKSSEVLRQQTISGSLLTGSYVQEICPDAMAIADYNGSLRIYYMSSWKNPSQTGKTLKDWLQRQVEIMQGFMGWQKRWTKRHESLLQFESLKEQEELKQKEEEEEKAKAKQEEEKELLAYEAAKLAAQKLKPLPGAYREWAQNQWKDRELKRMNRVLLHAKKLNPVSLREQQKPLKQAQKEETEKRKKMASRHRNADKIFSDTVAMYFPHILQKPAPPPKDPYAGGNTEEEKRDVLKNYKEQTANLGNFIADNPFKFKFDWIDIVKSGRERHRVAMTFTRKYSHMVRHEKEKYDRMEKQEDETESTLNESQEVHSDEVLNGLENYDFPTLYEQDHGKSVSERQPLVGFDVESLQRDSNVGTGMEVSGAVPAKSSMSAIGSIDTRRRTSGAKGSSRKSLLAKTQGSRTSKGSNHKTSDSRTSSASGSRISSRKSSATRLSNAKASAARLSNVRNSLAKLTSSRTLAGRISKARISDARTPDAKTSEIKFRSAKASNA